MTEPESEAGAGTFRTSITMPVSLAEFARARSGGNFSAYLASLVERDRRRDLAHQRLAEFGYEDDMAPTEEGRARARAVLEAHRERKRMLGGSGQRAA
ncbi:hypothetical protein [Catellatospora citrea]|uniref:Uncharacterized protein n=1 Tax=Catellatospora citrea TaxID=53366 RepID=A0A8J3KHQ5_9ACTN|nr:hypothetical protein [Catellatospora citrea]RKE10841.1 hypothetical protein C8E86_5760 [Catellatospora citrea]GIG00920.1 hypothetical protein Cci01nite_60130 [Catellatospora citrea]